MTVNSASGSKLFIGGPNSDRNTVLGTFQADSYVEVGECEDLGEFGDSAAVITFTSLSDGRVRKFKGPRDAGDMQVVVGSDPLDPGQISMRAAQATQFDYNFYVQFNDAVTLGGNDSKHYFIGKVMTEKAKVGNASNVITRTFTIGVNSNPIETSPS